MTQRRTTLVVAGLLALTGLLAFSTELLGKTDDLPWHDPALLDEQPARLSPAEEALLNPKKLQPLPPERIDSETLWLARAIYSESHLPEEQLLVAWVVRNRVDTRFRGKRSYEAVVLDPFQFSAFTPDTTKQPFYSGLDEHSRAPGWQRTLRIAHTVRALDPIYRPFSSETRHFFSAISRSNGSAPAWATDLLPVSLPDPYQVELHRFRFYEGIN